MATLVIGYKSSPRLVIGYKSPRQEKATNKIIFNTRAPVLRRHASAKALPMAEQWVVHKFGGTSVGKFSDNIGNIVLASLKTGHRMAVVCSARSSTIKTEGTTTRLMRAAQASLDTSSDDYKAIIQTIRLDHLQAGQDACKGWGVDKQEIFSEYSQGVNSECQNLLKALEAARTLGIVTDQTEDLAIAAGEKLSCMYMAMLLKSRGVRAVYVDLSQTVTFGDGKSLGEDFYRQLSEAIADRVLSLGPGVVPVITGFFGPVPGGLLNEVGRGYTDLCAALTSVGLKSKELQIWKEVDGIFSADPRKVPDAQLLSSVTPSEAAELTFYGSEVIHPFTMDQVIKANVPIRVKNVMNPQNQGTIILPDAQGEDLAVHDSRNNSHVVDLNRQLERPKHPTAITVKRNITVLNVRTKGYDRKHGVIMNIFEIIKDHRLNVDLISSSEGHVSMALHSERAMLSGQGEERMRVESAALQGAVNDLREWGEIDLVPDMAILTLVGRQLKSMVGVGGKFLSILGENGINIEMMSQGASEINISCVIEEREAERALKAVHKSLFAVN